MRRTITGDHVLFDLRPHWALTPPQIHALDQGADHYGQNLHLNARLTLSPPPDPSSSMTTHCAPAVADRMMGVEAGAVRVIMARVTGSGGDRSQTAASVAPPAALSRPRAVDDSEAGLSRPALPSPNGGMLP